MLDGRCWGGLIDELAVQLDAGDIIAFLQGSPHVLSSGPGMRAIPDLSYYRQPTDDQLPHRISIGRTRRRAHPVRISRLRCAALQSAAGGAAAGPASAWPSRPLELVFLIKGARSGTEGRRAGGEGVLARLGELLLFEAIGATSKGSIPSRPDGWPGSATAMSARR